MIPSLPRAPFNYDVWRQLRQSKPLIQEIGSTLLMDLDEPYVTTYRLSGILPAPFMKPEPGFDELAVHYGKYKTPETL